MTNDTTTIEITGDQHDDLEERKQHKRESFKSVVGRLLDREETPATNGVELGDLRDQLDRIESAASTAEERTGSIENTLEGLSR